MKIIVIPNVNSTQCVFQLNDEEGEFEEQDSWLSRSSERYWYYRY